MIHHRRIGASCITLHLHGVVLDNVESTYTGDAFVVYHHRHSDDNVLQPQTTSQLIDDEAYKNILCSYSLREEVDNKTHVRLVQWSPNECKVTCCQMMITNIA